MDGQFVVLDAIATRGDVQRYYFDGRTSAFVREDTVTIGAQYELKPRVVVSLRAEDYPVLAAIWDNDDDDDAFDAAFANVSPLDGGH